MVSNLKTQVGDHWNWAGNKRVGQISLLGTRSSFAPCPRRSSDHCCKGAPMESIPPFQVRPCSIPATDADPDIARKTALASGSLT